MIECQLHCLDGFQLSLITEAQQTEKTPVVFSKYCRTMCRGSNVKDKLETAFQLESLILAQNERWRQA